MDDPEHVDRELWAATRNRLIGEGVTEQDADAWIAAWEADADRNGLERGVAYWQSAWAWIAARRKHRGPAVELRLRLEANPPPVARPRNWPPLPGSSSGRGAWRASTVF